MSNTKNEKVDQPQQEEEQANPKDQELEQEPEEEPVDIELQKQMQKVNIDESVFEQQQSKQKQKHKNKKKATKNRGQDFLDYANKNNIQINLQYEAEEDKHYDNYQKKKQNDYSNQHQSQYQPQSDSQYQQQQNNQQEGMNQKGKYKGNNKYKYNNSINNSNFYKTNQQGRKVPAKFGENKFDACNNNMMPYQYGSTQNQQPQQYHQQQLQYHQYQQYSQPKYPNQTKEMTLTTDDQILGYIERLMSLNTLNKDLYLRFRINDQGMINITELANYYGLKNNNVTPQKIIDVISKNDSVSSVGVIEEDSTIYIAIKHWNTILPHLNSIDAISAKKNQIKAQQAQMNMFPNQYTPYTYIHMQNNYYIPNQGTNDIQGYSNNTNIPSQQED